MHLRREQYKDIMEYQLMIRHIVCQKRLLKNKVEEYNIENWKKDVEM